MSAMMPSQSILPRMQQVSFLISSRLQCDGYTKSSYARRSYQIQHIKALVTAIIFNWRSLHLMWNVYACHWFDNGLGLCIMGQHRIPLLSDGHTGDYCKGNFWYDVLVYKPLLIRLYTLCFQFAMSGANRTLPSQNLNDQSTDHRVSFNCYTYNDNVILLYIGSVGIGDEASLDAFIDWY